MRIYRISKKKYIEDLSGEGARLYGGRWNRRGDAMVYFSKSLSLAALEMLVHLDYQFVDGTFHFIEAEIPDTCITKLKSPLKVTENWRENPPNSRTQDYGSNWLKSNKSLGLQVSSAVLPIEHNILINPRHPDFFQLKIIKTGVLDVDERL